METEKYNLIAELEKNLKNFLKGMETCQLEFLS